MPRQSPKKNMHLAYDPHDCDLFLERLENQSTFTRGYSPLFTAILEQLVIWIRDPVGTGKKLGLVDETIGFCNRMVSFLEEEFESNEVYSSLRLAGALHWYLLTEDPRVNSLRPYYKTVGGNESPNLDRFPEDLLRAFDGLGELLFEKARKWQIQTNETSRGLAWLLPAVLVNAEAIHLIEIGASAGLNLYGEQRHYKLVWDDGSSLEIGRGKPEQFRCEVSGPKPLHDQPLNTQGPDILERIGGDIHPIDLSSPEAETHLEACVWGDQDGRLKRLREAFDVHHKAQVGTIRPTIDLEPMLLPEELDDFLRRKSPSLPSAPIVVFNSYVTAYLNDVDQRSVARSIRNKARNWSIQHGLPWMWVRFEPARRGEAEEPHIGWCRWLVEVWQGSEYRKFDLGWAHPHMHRLELSKSIHDLQLWSQG